MATRAKATAPPRRAGPPAQRKPAPDARVPDILVALIDEHKYQARLLRVLERQVGLLNQRKPPDYEVMHGVMRYMTQFPDRYHHPKEDLLFEKVVARDPPAADAVAQLRRAHVDITAAGAHLFELVERARQGEDEALRDPLRKSAHRYIGTLRHHMDIESLHLFPRAQATLRPEDWRAVDAAMKPILDPVFGQQVEPGFEKLHDQATAKPVPGDPGRIGAGLIEAAALIESVAALFSGLTALRKTMTQHHAQVLRQNIELSRSLMEHVPLTERGRLMAEVCTSNVRMVSEVQSRMTQLWSDTWQAVWRPYDVEPGPYAPKLLQRRRRREAPAGKSKQF